MGRRVRRRRRGPGRHAVGIFDGVLLASWGVNMGLQGGGYMAETTTARGCNGRAAQCCIWIHEVESVKVPWCMQYTAFRFSIDRVSASWLWCIFQFSYAHVTHYSDWAIPEFARVATATTTIFQYRVTASQYLATYSECNMSGTTPRASSTPRRCVHRRHSDRSIATIAASI